MPHILIVEDDTFLAKAYQLKFTKVGFTVRLAADGEQALAAIEAEKPDIILLDLVMPKKDGFATLTEIKQHPEWHDIPVIVASNLGQKEDIDRATELGAKDFVIKSDMSLEAIVELVNQYLALPA